MDSVLDNFFFLCLVVFESYSIGLLGPSEAAYLTNRIALYWMSIEDYPQLGGLYLIRLASIGYLSPINLLTPKTPCQNHTTIQPP